VIRVQKQSTSTFSENMGASREQKNSGEGPLLDERVGRGGGFGNN